MSAKLPVLFQAHGAPMLLDDARWMGELGGWAAALARPRAVLMVSAHWEAQPVTLGFFFLSAAFAFMSSMLPATSRE